MMLKIDSLPALPPSWTWTKLGEISKIGQGGTPSTKKKEYWGGNIPWLRSGEVLFNRITGSKDAITEIGLKNSPAKLLSKGTVLLAMTGEGLTRGRAAILDIEASANQSCAHIILDPRVMRSEYLFYYFRKEYWNIRQLDKGTNQPGLNTAIIKEFGIPVAPVAEQQRIVSRIEELFTHLDAGVKSLQKTEAQLKRYRQAVLRHAIQGKLTEKWRNLKVPVETAEPLLQKIKEEPTGGGSERWRNIEPIDPKNLPEIPKSWLWVRAQDVCENITNGYTPPASELHRSGGDIPFIKVNNLTFTGRLDFSKNSTFIGKKLHLTQLKRSMVFPGDILINIVGPPLGKVSIVPNSYPEWNINQAIVFYRPVKGYDRNFLALCLLSNAISSHLANQARATAGQFNISVTMCRNLPVPLPPLLEQEKIVSEVEKRFDILEGVEATVDESILRAKSLRSSILKNAFEGRLASQDPSDEPAGKLLERIREERTKSKSEKDTNKKNKSTQLGVSIYVE